MSPNTYLQVISFLATKKIIIINSSTSIYEGKRAVVPFSFPSSRISRCRAGLWHYFDTRTERCAAPVPAPGERRSRAPRRAAGSPAVPPHEGGAPRRRVRDSRSERKGSTRWVPSRRARGSRPRRRLRPRQGSLTAPLRAALPGPARRRGEVSVPLPS